MKKIRALKPFRYAGRALQPGEVFEAIDRDAKLLKRVGRVADHIESEPVARASVVSAPPASSAVESIAGAAEEAEEESPRVPRHYRRRDMTAEEAE